MQALSILLVITQFFAGALDTVQSQLLGVFNIFDREYSIEQFVRNLNVLIGPVRNPSQPDLELQAKSAVILDQDSNRVLFSKNDTDQLPMASITKIMTALVVLDKYGDRLETVIAVPAEAIKTNGSKMYLYTNERLTAMNLLKGLLIHSANDAALTFAYHIAGGEEKFAKLMNAKAQTLGLWNTHFANPIGFDAPDHYSTAKDLAELTRVAVNNPTFAQIVATKKIIVTDVSGRFKHSLDNTNKLIGQYDNVIGVKTGTTDEAGASLVASAVGGSGQKVIVVLLDSPDRFAEGKQALDWALKAYGWIEPL